MFSGKDAKVKGLAAPSNLSMNQSLEGHSGKYVYSSFYCVSVCVCEKERKRERAREASAREREREREKERERERESL